MEIKDKICIECEKIPYSVFENSEIKDLSIIIDEFDLGSCESLKQNYLNRLPELQKLSLIGINIPYDIFKKEICNLNLLEELTIMYSFLIKIPEEIEYLTKLKILVLRGNNIDFIPESISKLKNIEEINFIDNKIADIPISLSNLKKLKELNLRNNPLHSRYFKMIHKTGNIDLSELKLMK